MAAGGRDKIILSLLSVPKMSGSSYISVLPTLIKNTIKKELYDIYITDSLCVIGENTAKYAGGSYIKKRWISFIEDNPQKEQTGEEIVAQVIEKTGLRLISST